jgi:hypothetical protein
LRVINLVEMKFKALIIWVLTLSSLSTNAQLKDFLFKNFHEKRTLTYGLNNRNTSLLQESSTIYAGYIGIKYGDRLKHVITLNSTFFWVGKQTTDQGTIPHEAQLNFVGLSEEYTFWKHNKISLTSYLQIGFGQARIRPVLNDSYTIRKNVFPFEAGIHLGYSPLRWVDLRTGVGYRYTLNQGDWRLSSVYYRLGLAVNIKELKNWIKETQPIIDRIKKSKNSFPKRI